jgi:hypothetical protein
MDAAATYGLHHGEINATEGLSLKDWISGSEFRVKGSGLRV